jgi:threonine aldolase
MILSFMATKAMPHHKETVIAQAEVGDDVLGDDPTVQRLQELAAYAVDKEAAIWVPSGTMGNLSAVLAHCCERGSEVRHVMIS